MKKKWVIIAALAVAVLAGLLVFLWLRGSGTSQSPAFTGTVTDVRVTIKPSSAHPLLGSSQADYYEITYGYQMDGKWTDLPAKSFPFYCNPEFCWYRRQGAVCEVDHIKLPNIVPIGDLVLISLPYCQELPKDPLGTEVLEPTWEVEPDPDRYHFATFRYIGSDQKERYSQHKLINQRYLVLNVSALPDDYELEYFYCEAEHEHDEGCWHILTVDTICSAILSLEVARETVS